jgi:hypothetical protein
MGRTYSEMCVLEQLRLHEDWWYSMSSFARRTGYTTMSTRLTLDSLCREGVVCKLIDAEGEGYFLAEEDECSS